MFQAKPYNLRIMWRWVMLGALGLVVLARPGGERSASADPPPVPPEYAALHSELSAVLTAFESQVDSEWGGSVGPGRFAGALAAANGNKSAGLLTAQQWTRIIDMLDAFESMCVELVKLDTHYPVFSPAFHSYLAANPPPLIPGYNLSAQHFLGTPSSFYNRLVTEIRSRGMGLWIEHSTLFGDYTPTPPAGYFAEMRSAGPAAARARYTAERSAESAAIVAELAPDYYTVLEEPETQNANFGDFTSPPEPLFDAAGWEVFVGTAVAAIESAAPGSPTMLGAGAGTWDDVTYIDRFAAMPGLDYVDMHMYPFRTAGQSYLQRALDWTDRVRSISPSKRVIVGEAWGYKASLAEVAGGLDADAIFGRDVYSFWEPLDSQFLGVLFKLMQHKRIEAVMPFWQQYFFAYLTYGDPELEGLGPLELLALAGTRSAENIAAGVLTGTGEAFAALLAAVPDADGDGVPDAADSSDTDGDGAPDSADACPLIATAWIAALGDRDCDGFSAAAEGAIGTKPGMGCGFTPGGAPAARSWPPDLVESNSVNIQDVLALKPVFNQPVPPVAARYDLVPSGAINISDVLAVKPFFNRACPQ
jgi:hypothetical protein